MATSNAESVNKVTSAQLCDNTSAIIERHTENPAENSTETNAATVTVAELCCDKTAEQQSSSNQEISCATEIKQKPNLPATILQSEGRPRVLFIFLKCRLPTRYVVHMHLAYTVLS